MALAPGSQAGAAPARKAAASSAHAHKKTAAPAKKGSASARKGVAKKEPAKKAAAKKSGGKKTAAKKVPLKKESAKKKETARKTAARSSRKPIRAASKSARAERRNQRQASAAERPVASSSPRSGGDRLNLKSSVALVLDQDTQEVLVRKDDQAVLPIASLTKLMTGLIIADAGLPMDETITITDADIDTDKGSHSRLAVGARLTRGELLHLALMSSENRAAHALGRTFPGGLNRFVGLMNARAARLGMSHTHYVEPTGLSSSNRSSAHDLAVLVDAASQHPLLRQLTTSPGYEVAVGNHILQYNNTNRLVRDPEWHIGLQKTGFINEAGHCLVMQARVGGRKLIMVFLDSEGKYTRLADAERVRRWVELRHAVSTVAGTPVRRGE
jgi:D-alanyl-D-alanine endopeptidase (penicillin-binding protein 7)